MVGPHTTVHVPMEGLPDPSEPAFRKLWGREIARFGILASCTLLKHQRKAFQWDLPMYPKGLVTSPGVLQNM